MVYLDVLSNDNNILKKVSEVCVDVNIFNVLFNETLVHQVVNCCIVNTKMGTKSQKTRSEVRGGGVKPWKQKTTGRARAGSIRSPLWRGGGKTFAAKPFKKISKINKKMYKLSMCSVLSELLRQKRFFCFLNFILDKPSTECLLKIFSKIPGKTKLVITSNCCINVYKSSLNIKDICFIDVVQISLLNLLKFETVIVFDVAMGQLISKVRL